MAIIDPEWSWWYCAFWAVLLGPLSADGKSREPPNCVPVAEPSVVDIVIWTAVIFTVANLIITDIFTPKTQALAGAVFNTVAQFGTSIGLTVLAIISASVTNRSEHESKGSPEALMLGYRAAFWACFALMMLACGIGTWGLRKVGKVGLKRE